MTLNTLELTRQLSAWLADTDIELLELEGPQTSLRLRRAIRAPVALSPTAAAEPSNLAAPAAGTTLVRADSVGVLLHRHPQRHAPLAPVGTRVRAGQPVALLRIGTLLLPVPAPRDGVVARLIADDGAALGYGEPLLELAD
jgi:acetyl-CoA carboxylase biotin carboxyl carrier protein